MQIGFLTCPGTHPGSPERRADAFEHDLQVDAIRPELEKLGHELIEIDWRSPVESLVHCAAVLIGTPWDYQDSEEEFRAKLESLEAAGILVCNSPSVVLWNSRKTYLRELAERGAATIPTLLVEAPTARDIRDAMEEFGTDSIVAKRQVGANAEGQSIHHKASLDPEWCMPHPAMLQPFLPQIQSDGEYSFLIIDGRFSHALRKLPADDDYRVQSGYGGREETFEPSTEERAAAEAIIEALPFDAPLYARIDMVRGDDGTLLLMEAEMIEPFLYPVQGPQLGSLIVAGINRRLEARAAKAT